LRKTYEDFVRAAKSRIREIDVAAARARYDADDGCLFLDVREKDEVAAGTIPGALCMPRGRLEGHAGDVIPDFDWEIVVICEKGNRSALAADTLREMGFTRVASLSGGMLAWTAARHPVGAPRVL
jgi:rhodanese-related sulfurtransferase